MALLGRTLDYTDKDFDSLNARVDNLIDSVFPTWTDRNRANFGNILKELIPHVGDLLGFNLDASIRESRITQATQRRALIALAKLVAYAPATARAATTNVVFTLAAIPAGRVRFSRGQKVKTKNTVNPVAFQALADFEIGAGANPPSLSVPMENSEFREDVFASTGLPNQEILLASRPFLDGSLELSAADGSYTVVDSLLDSTSTDRHCTIVVDQNDRARVRFGDGVSGSIPSGTIVAAYKTGGGIAGNVDANTLTKIDGVFTDEFGNPVQVSVTNPSPVVDGENRETIAQIRLRAPKSVRVSDRTVSREDYEINVMKPPSLGIARALMLTSNEDPGIGENQGILYIIPVGGGVPSTSLKAAALERVTVTYPKTITFQPAVQNPVYLTVNIDAKVHLASGAQAATVKAAILAALADWFAIQLADGTPNPNVDFGFYLKKQDGTPANEIAWTTILNVIRDTTGVRKVSADLDGLLLNGVRDDLAIAVREFPILGTVTLVNGDTGAPL